MNGLDLFSGIGGLTIALSEWVNPIAYCENDRYAQSVLLSRMSEGLLPVAPIWDDVTTLNASMLPTEIEIIYGGFPCQDISVAGLGKGLEGKRSGLFFEIMRLAKEIKPAFIFLENVPAIRTRGLETVVGELSGAGYDCRWGMLSAYDVGAPHKRERWFLLAYSGSERRQQIPGGSYGHESKNERWTKKKTDQPKRNGEGDRNGFVAYSKSNGDRRNAGGIFGQDGQVERPQDEYEKENLNPGSSRKDVPHTNSERLEIRELRDTRQQPPTFRGDWWGVESSVCRVAVGLPNRVDRIKCLGNAVVPMQAREAFRRLSGVKLEAVK